jgi:hypothetical protein
MANPSSEFQYDVFLSHSAKDRAVVRPLGGQLRRDGPNVWPVPPKPLGVGGFDEWVLKPGDNIPARIEKGSAHSNILRNEGGQMKATTWVSVLRPTELPFLVIFFGASGLT